MPKYTDELNLFKWDTSNSSDLGKKFDIETALNGNWDKLDDRAKETKKSIDKQTTDISTNKDNITKNTKNISTNTQNITKNTGEIQKLQEEITNSNVTRGHVYTAIFDTSTSTPTLQRADDAIGMTANATKNGQAVENDFDNVWPWAGIKPFNIDIETGEIKAWMGEPGFQLDGSNGDVYVHFPTFWVRVWKPDETHIAYSVADYARSGYTEIKEFSTMKYKAGIGEDGKLHSYSGLLTAGEKSIVQYRKLVTDNMGEGYCLMDWRYFAIQILYLVEYATFNSQSALGNGITGMRYATADVALIAEESTNKFVVNTAGGNAFVVGQRISIGTAVGNYGVARDRKITAINTYASGDIQGKEIIFDGDPVNIITTNVIWSSPQYSGGCDELQSPSGTMNNDSKHPVAYRYIENIFGDNYTWIDGINIKDRQAYICYEPTEYVSDKFEKPYSKLGYVDAEADNGYIKKLGYDEANPLIALPTETGGSGSGSTSYMCDYNYNSTGQRAARVGGYLFDGAIAGLWYWSLNGASSGASWICGARVLKYQ